MMNIIDFSIPNLAAAIKANLFAMFEYLSHSPRTERCDSPEISWVLTGLTHAFLNNILQTRFTPTDVDERIAQTLGTLRSKIVSRFTWWIEPGTQPADLGEHLQRHGLTYSSGSPGMAADLLSLNEDLHSPPGLAIAAVCDRQGLEAWVRAGFTSLGGLAAEEDACIELLAGLGFDLPLRSYLGLLDGKPVATAQLFLGAGVAGIYWVATAPEARRQGISAAVTLAALREARALGYRVAILHTSSMGEGVYRRLGFQEYCRMSCYEYAG